MSSSSPSSSKEFNVCSHLEEPITPFTQSVPPTKPAPKPDLANPDEDGNQMNSERTSSLVSVEVSVGPKVSSVSDGMFTSPSYSSRRAPKRKKGRGGGSYKKKQAIEKKLQTLAERLNLVPFIPSKALDFAKHEMLLKSLGLWNFVSIGLGSDFNNVRSDLVAQLIATYDPKSRCGYVNDVRIKVNRADLARAFKLPLKKEKVDAGDLDLTAVSSESSVAFLEDFVSNWVILNNNEELWIMPEEAVNLTKPIHDGHPEKMDWSTLLWFMVEQELMLGEQLVHCNYASHLQHLIRSQREDLLSMEPEEGVTSQETETVLQERDSDKLILMEEPKSGETCEEEVLEKKDDCDEEEVLEGKGQDEEEMVLKKNDDGKEVLENKGQNKEEKVLEKKDVGDEEEVLKVKGQDTVEKVLEKKNDDEELLEKDHEEEVLETDNGVKEVVLQTEDVKEEVLEMKQDDGEEEVMETDNGVKEVVLETEDVKEEVLEMKQDDGEEEVMEKKDDGDEEKVLEKDQHNVEEVLEMKDDVEEEELAKKDDAKEENTLEKKDDAKEEVVMEKKDDAKEEVVLEKNDNGGNEGAITADEVREVGEVENNVKGEPSVELALGQELITEEVSKDDEMMDFEQFNYDHVEQDQRQWLLNEKNTVGEHFLQRCSTRDNRGSSDYIEENNGIDEGEEGMVAEHGFDVLPAIDEFVGEGLDVNFLGTMAAAKLTYGSQGSLGHHHPSVDIMDSQNDLHESGPSYYHNNGKRKVHDDVHISPHADDNKRIRTEQDSSDHQPGDFEACLERIQSLIERAKTLYMEKVEDQEHSNMNQQMLFDELQKRDAVIERLHLMKQEEIEKRDLQIYRLNRELFLMCKLLDDYKKALKQTDKAFDEYRQKNQQLLEEPVYKDAGDGGLVLSITDIEKQRQKEEDSVKLEIEQKVKEAEEAYASQFQEFLDKVSRLDKKLSVFENEFKSLKDSFSRPKISQKLSS